MESSSPQNLLHYVQMFDLDPPSQRPVLNHLDVSEGRRLDADFRLLLPLTLFMSCGSAAPVPGAAGEEKSHHNKLCLGICPGNHPATSFSGSTSTRPDVNPELNFDL
ncbi:unnamed protein product [Pleuronectes platessa]|uniref:Uncharacterized protein n=1 Tax=Pleuronectes platessa TaxID=8262 RepID=A0A9N7YBQ0_PLEPL|nr:unnamed protein product [Pleuronectes platessa]